MQLTNNSLVSYLPDYGFMLRRNMYPIYGCYIHLLRGLCIY